MTTKPADRPSLGQFLRARRERLQPQDVGIDGGPRRRAAGLRREEVAALAGISPTWVTWIEQGRATSVSAQTLSALARALRLSAAERTYLFQLAARDEAVPAEAAALPHQAHLQALVRAIRAPAYVLDRNWNAVAWNAAAAKHFDRWLPRRVDGSTPNLLRWVHTDPQARSFIDPWAERAERLVAEFRADTAGWSDDPARRALVEELSAVSPEFRAAWSSQRVLSREGGMRRFVHPVRGRIEFEQSSWRLASQRELKLTVLLAV